MPGAPPREISFSAPGSLPVPETRRSYVFPCLGKPAPHVPARSEPDIPRAPEPRSPRSQSRPQPAIRRRQAAHRLDARHRGLIRDLVSRSSGAGERAGGDTPDSRPVRPVLADRPDWTRRTPRRPARLSSQHSGHSRRGCPRRPRPCSTPEVRRAGSRTRLSPPPKGTPRALNMRGGIAVHLSISPAARSGVTAGKPSPSVWHRQAG